MATFRNPRRVGFKNTNSGPLFLDTFTAASNGFFTAETGATHSYSPADYGATGARFALVQVLTADANVVFETGISGSITDPTNGSARSGRTFGMQFIQLPVDETTEIRIMADPVAGITCNYTINFVD